MDDCKRERRVGNSPPSRPWDWSPGLHPGCSLGCTLGCSAAFPITEFPESTKFHPQGDMAHRSCCLATRPWPNAPQSTRCRPRPPGSARHSHRCRSTTLSRQCLLPGGTRL